MEAGRRVEGESAGRLVGWSEHRKGEVEGRSKGRRSREGPGETKLIAHVHAPWPFLNQRTSWPTLCTLGADPILRWRPPVLSTAQIYVEKNVLGYQRLRNNKQDSVYREMVARWSVGSSPGAGTQGSVYIGK